MLIEPPNNRPIRGILDNLVKIDIFEEKTLVSDK